MTTPAFIRFLTRDAAPEVVFQRMDGAPEFVVPKLKGACARSYVEALRAEGWSEEDVFVVGPAQEDEMTGDYEYEVTTPGGRGRPRWNVVARSGDEILWRGDSARFLKEDLSGWTVVGEFPSYRLAAAIDRAGRSLAVWNNDEHAVDILGMEGQRLQLRHPLDEEHRPETLRFSPSGRLLLVTCAETHGGNEHIRVLSLADGKETTRLLPPFPTRLYSVGIDDGDRHVCGGGFYGRALTWDLPSGRLQGEFRLTDEGAEGNPEAYGTALDPTGTWLAAGGYACPAVRIWNVADGSLVKEVPSRCTISKVMFASPDRLLLNGSVWDWKRGELVAEIAAADFMALSADRGLLLGADHGGRGTSLSVYRTRDWKRLAKRPALGFEAVAAGHCAATGEILAALHSMMESPPRRTVVVRRRP